MARAIGVEFSYFYNALGTKVTLVEMLPQVLPIEDEEISKELERSFTKKGIGWRTSTKVGALERDGAVVRAKLSGPKGEIIWDGLDDTRQRVRIGPYIVFVEAVDGQAGVVATAKVVAVVAAKL